MLKKLLVSRNEPRELENIDARNLDVLIAIFLLRVKKKTENNTAFDKTWTGLDW